MTTAVLLLNLTATCALTGLIWMVQLVHYPLFAEVGRDAFREYHDRHTRRITSVVAPLMLAELVGALLLVLFRPQQVAALAAWAAAGLVAVCWLSTALVQVPLHRRLAADYDVAAHRSLVATNWVRTAAWTARAALLLGMVAA